MRDIFAWLVCDSLVPMALVAGHHKLDLGRSSECNFVLPHPAVSKRHAVIKVSHKLAVVEDLGSANGVYVNGKKIFQQLLRIGDIIEIKPFSIKFSPHDHQETSTQEIPTSLFLTSKSILSGKIKAGSLIELFQSLEFNQKTCSVMVHNIKTQGHLVFIAGMPIWASFGETHGVEAVFAMLKSRAGHFSVDADISVVRKLPINKMEISMTALLLEASRLDDSNKFEEDPTERL